MKQMGGNRRDRGLDGVGSMGQRGGLGGVSSGQIAGGEDLDRTTKAYDAIVGDGQRSEAERSFEQRSRALNGQPKPDTISAQQDAVDNTYGAFNNRTKFGTGLIPAALAVGRNELMANSVVNENDAMVESRNLAPETLDTSQREMAGAMHSASMGDTTFGLLGNQSDIGKAAVGDYLPPSPGRIGRANDVGGNRQPGILENKIGPRARDRPSPDKPPQKDNSFGYGNLTNYGSYKRRVLNNL
mgnify:CR=1 FL=1